MNDAKSFFADRQRFEQMLSNCQQIETLISEKCDLNRFEAFKAIEVQEMTEVKGSLAKKSNIKDVCALLDMKSSK